VSLILQNYVKVISCKKSKKSGGRQMTKNNSVNNHDALKKDLENLNLKIENALNNSSLSEEGLKTLIKEAEEIQKRLIYNTENTQEKEEDK